MAIPITTSCNKRRYLRFTQPTTGYVGLAEIEVYLQNSSVNIAAGKTVTQSSFYDQTNYPASNLTDGKYNTFTDTGNSGSGWMELDLGTEYANIGTIVVVSRPTTAVLGRIKGASLSLYNSSRIVVWVSDVFRGKTGSATYQGGSSDAFLYYVVNGAYSYNIGPIFSSASDSATTATLYEAKTTTTNNPPTTSPTQWQPILTAMINGVDGATTTATPNTITLRDNKGSSSFNEVNATTINFPSTEQSKKLVLWDGSPGDPYGTNFYGLEINNGTLRYQTGGGGVHRFYHANSEVGNLSTTGLRITGGLSALYGSSGVTLSPNVGSGSSSPATVYSIVGNALGGRISINTNNAPAGGGLICIVSFPAGVYPNHVTAVLTPGNALTSVLSAQYKPYIDPTSRPNQFWIVSGGGPLLGHSTYIWYYMSTGW